VVFEESLREDEIQFKSEILHLSNKHLPLRSIKQQSDLSLIIETETGYYIFDKNISPKLQVWKEKEISTDFIVFLDRDWENDYLKENAH
jgi:hypothetical protein